MTATHYPHAEPIPLTDRDRAGGAKRPVYVPACSCGWRATVRHASRDAALPAAIAHARDANHPELTP